MQLKGTGNTKMSRENAPSLNFSRRDIAQAVHRESHWAAQKAAHRARERVRARITVEVQRIHRTQTRATLEPIPPRNSSRPHDC